MTGLEQSRHMCDMSLGIFEAKAKLFERRILGFEDVKQRLSTIGQSEVHSCEKTGVQLTHSRVPHLLPIPAG